MSWSQIADFENLRTLGFASTSGAYVPIGTPFLYPPRVICITNDTDGAMYFSNDGINDKLYLPKNSFKLFDLTTNKGGADGAWCLLQSTQMYVRQYTVPTTGLITIELIYGKGD